MTSPLNKQDGLHEVALIAQRYGLTRHDILSAINTENEDKVSTSLQNFLVYMGSALVFVGVCTYIGMSWSELDSLARVIITLGSGFVAFILGLISLGDQKFSKASTPLFLIGAFMETTGLFVALDEYFPSSGNFSLAASIVFGFMLIQQVLAFQACRRTSLLFLTMSFFYLFMNAFLQSTFDMDARIIALALGASCLLVSYHVNKTSYHAITPFFFLFATLMLAAASFDYLKNTPCDVLMIAVVGGLFYVSVMARSRALLAGSVLTLLAYLAYFTNQYFKDVAGWPISLICMGLVMIGVSSFALKLGKRMRTEPQS